MANTSIQAFSVRLLGASALMLAGAATGCDDDGSTQKADSGTNTRDGGGKDDDSQTPPQGAKAVEAWLADGAYLDWACEDEVHGSRSPSPHGFNRICSNDVIADAVRDDGAWPKGAAAVKELYDNADGDNIIGYAVYLKTANASKGGDNWYWYERVPLDHPAPHDDDGVVADGLGDKGPEKSICVGCHVAAGADEAHTPTKYGRDQVYTPVD